jgi:hypothetical protein
MVAVSMSPMTATVKALHEKLLVNLLKLDGAVRSLAWELIAHYQDERTPQIAQRLGDMFDQYI